MSSFMDMSIVKQKLSKSIAIIKRVRKNLPQCVLITLYFSLVHMYLEYCNIVLCFIKHSSMTCTPYNITIFVFILQKKSTSCYHFLKMGCSFYTAPLLGRLFDSLLLLFAGVPGEHC